MTGETRPLVVAVAGFATIAAVAIGVIVDDSPAKSAAANAPKPVEYAPPVGETIPRDGTWIVDKEIKRGTYRTAGSGICLWQRLEGSVSGRWVVVAEAFRANPQEVALGKDDVAFVTWGCPAWELVR